MIASFLLALAQAAAAPPSINLPPQRAAATETQPSSSRATLPVGTEIHLQLMSELSTKKNKKGDTFELEVSDDVLIDGRTVIPRGTIAIGELTRSDPKGAFGESGKLEARVLYANLARGPVRLSGRLGVAGEGGTAATVVTAVLAGTLAFAVTGKSAVIPAGARLLASTDRTLSVDLLDAEGTE